MRVITGILAVLALLASGCTQAAAPSSLPTPSRTATASPVPSETGLAVITSEPEDVVADAAAMFVEAYVSTANRALSEPEAMADWEEQFAPSCRVCVSGFETAQSIHERGHLIEGGELTDWTVTPGDETAEQSVFTVSGTITEATELTQNGAIINSYAAVPDVTLVYTVRLQPDGSWLVVAGELLG
jgi:hypothetical protein